MEEKDRYAELAERTARRGITLFTRFLDLNGQKEASAAARRAGVQCRLFGGAEGCERQVLAYFDTEPPENAEYPIVCLRISPRSKRFSEPMAHRDVLGSLMSLGLERETLGDILTSEDGCLVFCLPSLARIILDSLEQVGGCDVHCSETEAPGAVEKKTEELVLQVVSPRADAVVAHLFRLSRSDTDELFRSGRVLVDDAPCSKPEKQLTEGCVLSVRGFGRARYVGVDSVSKKGKQNIRIALYR